MSHMGQMRIHYSAPIAGTLSSTLRAPWTRARLWKFQGHDAFGKARGHSGRFCPPLSHGFSNSSCAEGRSANDARSSGVGWAIAICCRSQAIDAWNGWAGTVMASREKSKREMETTASIKWYGTQKLDLFANEAHKCEPSSSAFEWVQNVIRNSSAYEFSPKER